MRTAAALLLLALGLSAQDRYPFRPALDDFRADALLDLRYLNEKVAGESGWVKTTGDGDFVLGNGKPVRFWAVNTTVAREKPFVARPRWSPAEPQLEQHARFLAKRGVNMVRLHAFLNPPVTKALTDINETDRDWIWRTVAAMKSQGIYTTVSPYWANNMKFNAAWGVAAMDGKEDGHALLFFDETMQAAYKEWLRKLLAEVNPYTGIPLAKDPALAILMLQNEDSLLFYTVDRLAGEQRKKLQLKYGAWLKAKYGSLDDAVKAWGGAALKTDDFANGSADFYIVWEMTQLRTGAVARRLADQQEFWVTVMRDFNSGMERYLREELGAGQLICPGNWKSADPVRLEDSERYSYTTGQVLAVNRYFSGVHNGTNRTWAIINNDEFTSPSVLLNPRTFPLALKQVKGYPMMVTESTWVMPMAYSAEGPFLVSVFQSLTGVDAYFWFNTGDEQWSPPQSANGYLASQQKWMFGSPDMLGTFPGAALMHRMGYVRKGDAVVEESRALTDMWMRRTPIIAESASWDPNRDAGDIAPESNVKTAVDPLAFFMGPVLVEPGGNPAATKVADTGRLLSADRKTVTSITNEVTLNSDRGWCTVNAPKAQGVAAFFKYQSEFDLADVWIWSGNDYGTVIAAAMDDRPLKESKKILVQVGTQSRPLDWVEEPKTIKVNNVDTDGLVVKNFGKAPWMVAKPLVVMEVRNSGLTRAQVLDANGNVVYTLYNLERTARGVRFTFPQEALYAVLE